jgi:hypothetical protein
VIVAETSVELILALTAALPNVDMDRADDEERDSERDRVKHRRDYSLGERLKPSRRVQELL